MQNKVGEIILVDINRLNSNPKNPNHHSQSQIERLTKIIAAQGFRNPVVVSNQSGYIVAGHGRVLAAKNAGLKQVPVSYQDFESEALEYAHMCADNAIADWADLDLSQINSNIIDLGDFDIDLLGIERFKIDTSEIDTTKLDNVNESEAKDPSLHECPQCGFEFK